MMTDKQEYFLTTDGSETLGGYTSGTSDYRSLDAAKAHDGHRKKYLNIAGVANMTSTGADTLTIALVSDTDSGFATAKKTDHSFTAIGKSAIAATRLKIALPEGIYNFYRLEWTVSSAGTPSAGGTFRAWISNS